MPILLAIVLLLTIVGIQLFLSVRQNNGHLVYALDDPYIHMAIARNFSRYGVWGITRYEFSSSSSSLLWTLLLAGIYSFTSSAIVPLVLNIACGGLVLVVANSLLQERLTRNFVFTLLISLVVLVPLPPLILSGMEHTAHLAICIALVYSSAAVIADQEFSWKSGNTKLLLILSALAPAIRYESLFIVLPVVALLTIRRRLAAAIAVSVLALAPVLTYGIISWQKGSYILPNPLLVKGSLPQAGLIDFLKIAGFKISSAPHLMFLWLLAVALFLPIKKRENWHRDRILLLIFILAMILHILFAGIGWFYRYEAYLVALGIMINGQSIVRQFELRQKGASRGAPGLRMVLIVVLSFGAGATLLVRASKALGSTVQATKNIYEQQYQMALFLRSYYSGAAVAANDVGAINFFADVRCLDLVGLGTAEVTRAKIHGRYNTRTIADLARTHQARIAVIYANWFDKEGGIPAQWIKAGQWTIPDCVVCGNPVVSFYAIEQSESEALRQNLENFSRHLPGDVAQTEFADKPDE